MEVFRQPKSVSQNCLASAYQNVRYISPFSEQHPNFPRPNPFTRQQIVPLHKRQDRYNFASVSESKLRNYRFKTESPFKNDSILQCKYQHQNNFTKKSKSHSVFNREKSNLYQIENYDLGWLATQSYKRRQANRRQKQIQIQRKRVNIFGVEVLRYASNNNQQEKNIEYFAKNPKQTIKSPSYDYFSQSQSVYSGNNGSKCRSQFRKESQRKKNHKNMSNKLKIKKMSSLQKQNQDIEVNSAIYKQVSSQNRLVSCKNHPYQEVQSVRFRENQSKYNDYNINDQKYQNKRSGFNKKQTVHEFRDSFGINNQNTQNLQASNKTSRFSTIPQFQDTKEKETKQKNKQSKKYQHEQSKDHILQLSDGFRFQQNSPSSSSISCNQDLIKFPQSNNLLYHSNPNKFQSFIATRLSQLQSSSSGSNLNMFFSSISSEMIKNKELMMNFRSMFDDTNCFKDNKKRNKEYPSKIRFNSQQYQLIDLQSYSGK